MFAIAGGKGGCGKTTTTLGVARALTRTGVDPLVVDADVDMPDLHLLADVPPEPNASDVADGAHVECVRRRSPEIPGVSVVPAGDTAATESALCRLANWHGPVLVDCPAGASVDAAVPLRNADATILVTTDTPQSLADARKTAQMASRVDAPIAGVLIRGPNAETVDAPVDAPVVERIDNSAGETPLTDTQFRRACRSISELIRSAPVGIER